MVAGEHGGHAQKEDWLTLLDFADWIYQKESTRRFDTLTYPNAELPLDWQAVLYGSFSITRSMRPRSIFCLSRSA